MSSSPDDNVIPTGPLNEADITSKATDISKPTDDPSRKYVWRNITLFVYLHIASLYGLYLALTSAKWST